jgi:hypothetical protein
VVKDYFPEVFCASLVVAQKIATNQDTTHTHTSAVFRGHIHNTSAGPSGHTHTHTHTHNCRSSGASIDGPDYTEQLPMLRGHPIPRAVLIMVGTQLLSSALEQAMCTLAARLIRGLVRGGDCCMRVCCVVNVCLYKMHVE